MNAMANVFLLAISVLLPLCAFAAGGTDVTKASEYDVVMVDTYAGAWKYEITGFVKPGRSTHTSSRRESNFISLPAVDW